MQSELCSLVELYLTSASCLCLGQRHIGPAQESLVLAELAGIPKLLSPNAGGGIGLYLGKLLLQGGDPTELARTGSFHPVQAITLFASQHQSKSPTQCQADDCAQ